MNRRSLLGRLSALFTLGSGSEPLFAAPAETSIAAPKEPWAATTFDYSSQSRTYPGVAVRLPDQGLYVACRICPHQGCAFDYQTDFETVGDIVGEEFSNPVMFCRCHMSVFDPANGGRVLNGPAPRPPWTFTTRELDGNIVITSIEPGAGDIR